MRLAVTQAARRDLRNIACYTQKAWGAARKAQYLPAIRAQFSALLRHLALGAPREDVADGYRSPPVGRHIIFCRIAGEDIVVLHQRMDVRLHF